MSEIQTVSATWAGRHTLYIVLSSAHRPEATHLYIKCSSAFRCLCRKCVGCSAFLCKYGEQGNGAAPRTARAALPGYRTAHAARKWRAVRYEEILFCRFYACTRLLWLYSVKAKIINKSCIYLYIYLSMASVIYTPIYIAQYGAARNPQTAFIVSAVWAHYNSEMKSFRSLHHSLLLHLSWETVVFGGKCYRHWTIVLS